MDESTGIILTDTGWVPCRVCGTLALDPHINQRPCVECGTDPVVDENDGV